MICQCGCGLPAPIARRSSTARGQRKGEPVQYIKGHCVPLRKRLESMYQVRPDGCWYWIGNIEFGYGRIGNRLAYRVIYEQQKGPVPAGLELDHTCRNRACVNPDHLEPVSRRENVRRGNATKLNSEKVIEIRQRRQQGEAWASIARAYGVTPACARHAAVGLTWADVEGWR